MKRKDCEGCEYLTKHGTVLWCQEHDRRIKNVITCSKSSKDGE